MEWKHNNITTGNLHDLYHFIDQYKELTDSHSVDYFTENHWERLIPDEWKDDLLSLSETELFLYPERINTTSLCPLKDFLTSIQRLKLLSSDRSQETPPPATPPDPSCVGQYGMSRKKVHEVERMSEYLKSVFIRPLNIKQIIDIGSGKGYLSEYLSFTHQLNVIGIESQPITTVGALERCRKVEKFFKTRSKEKASSNAEREGKDKGGGERGGEEVQDDIVFEESLPLLLLDDAATVMPRQDNLTETVKEQHQTENTSIAVTVNKEETKKYGEESSSMDATEIKHIESCASRSINELPRNGTTHTVESNKEESICDGTTLNKETNIASNCHCDHSSTQQQPVHQLTESYTPIIHYLSNDDSVVSIVGDALDTTQPIGLVGLHTCGDLACIVLRQFVQEPAIRSVCLVGCCYHHITEERDVTGAAPPGFPMCQFLKSRGAFLGRNTRMLSCQSEAHFSTITSSKALQSIFYRAVLQVVLQKEMKLIQSPKDARELCVGRVKKCTSFTGYVRRALKKLNIPEIAQPSDDTLEDYHAKYLSRLTELQRYLQVRVVIAPLIESLILLDRLMFLQDHKEKCRIGETWLSQLFIPAVSPRCIALCAIKEQ